MGAEKQDNVRLGFFFLRACVGESGKRRSAGREVFSDLFNGRLVKPAHLHCALEMPDPVEKGGVAGPILVAFYDAAKPAPMRLIASALCPLHCVVEGYGGA